MANIKVSEMTEATSFDNGDYTMIVQANQNKKISKENVLGDIENNIETMSGDISTIENDISAINTDIQDIKNFLTFNNSETITTGTISGGGTLSSINVTIETNSDGSLAKIYGQVDIATSGKSGNIVLSTNLRPISQLNIAGTIYRSISNGGYVRNNALISMTIDTNGNITIPYVYSVNTSDACRLSLMASLIFIKGLNQNEEQGE